MCIRDSHRIIEIIGKAGQPRAEPVDSLLNRCNHKSADLPDRCNRIPFKKGQQNQCNTKYAKSDQNSQLVQDKEELTRLRELYDLDQQYTD